MRFLKKIQIEASATPSQKAIDVLRHYLLKEDAKKWSLVKLFEDYATSKNLDNDYMTKLGQKLQWLGGVLVEKYLPEDKNENEEE